MDRCNLTSAQKHCLPSFHRVGELSPSSMHVCTVSTCCSRNTSDRKFQSVFSNNAAPLFCSRFVSLDTDRSLLLDFQLIWRARLRYRSSTLLIWSLLSLVSFNRQLELVCRMITLILSNVHPNSDKSRLHEQRLLNDASRTMSYKFLPAFEFDSALRYCKNQTH